MNHQLFFFTLLMERELQSFLHTLKNVLQNERSEAKEVMAAQWRPRCATNAKYTVTVLHPFTFIICIVRGRYCLDPNENTPMACQNSPNTTLGCHPMTWKLSKNFKISFSICLQDNVPCAKGLFLMPCMQMGPGGDMQQQVETQTITLCETRADGTKDCVSNDDETSAVQLFDNQCFCVEDQNGVQICEPRRCMKP